MERTLIKFGCIWRKISRKSRRREIPRVHYKFPNSTKGDVELFDSVGAVAFRDINDDGKNDIIIIINYITGAGPQGIKGLCQNNLKNISLKIPKENSLYLPGPRIRKIQHRV